MNHPEVFPIATIVEAMKRVGILHPGAMGEKFWALLQSKDVPPPALLATVSNRVRRLI